MKIGIVLPNYGPGATRMALVDTALAAEKLGFSSIWVTDHMALPQAEAEVYGHIFEALTTLSYLAASTSRIKLGFSTLVLPQRNPIEVAKQIATLDALSGGRVLLTAGIGWSESEYSTLGQNFKNRGKRMDEALVVLRTLWRGGKVISHHGKYYSFEKLVFSPAPVQSGGPPIWVAGKSSAALRRAIRYADGWHPNRVSPDDLQTMLSGVHGLLGTRPFTVCIRQSVQFSATPQDGLLLSGTATDIITGLQAYEKAGANYAVLEFQADSQPSRERAMRTFAQDILPAINHA